MTYNYKRYIKKTKAGEDFQTHKTHILRISLGCSSFLFPANNVSITWQKRGVADLPDNGTVLLARSAVWQSRCSGIGVEGEDGRILGFIQTWPIRVVHACNRATLSPPFNRSIRVKQLCTPGMWVIRLESFRFRTVSQISHRSDDFHASLFRLGFYWGGGERDILSPPLIRMVVECFDPIKKFIEILSDSLLKKEIREFFFFLFFFFSRKYIRSR